MNRAIRTVSFCFKGLMILGVLVSIISTSGAAILEWMK